MFDMQKQDALDHEHSINPKVGDYWSEHFMPCAVVIEVTKYSVTFCEETKAHPEDKNSRTFDTDKLTTLTRSQYQNRWRYGSIQNKDFAHSNTKDISNKCWCMVSPERFSSNEIESWFQATNPR